jgi:hemin uptake protein HemP
MKPAPRRREAMAAPDRLLRPPLPADPEPAGPTIERRLPATGNGRRWTSADLFGTLSEIEIEHGPAIYRLRQTSLGKLILTK